MLKRKITAIVAADIAGYSRLVAEDEEETLRRLASYRAVFESFIARSGGRVFNTAGDSVMAEFPSAVEAVRCVLDTQESLRTRNMAYPSSRQMHFRMGVAIGDVVESNGDLLGDGVNVAARLGSIAPEGGLCISRSVYEAVSNKVSVRFSDRGYQRLKNMPDPVHAYVVSIGTEPKSPDLVSRLAGSRGMAGLVALVLIGAAATGAYLTLHPAPEKTVAIATPAAPSTTTVPSPRPPADDAAAASDARPAPAEKGGEQQNQAHADPAADPQERKHPLPGDSEVGRRLRECLGAPVSEALAPCREVVDWNIFSDADRARIELKLGRSLREKQDYVGAIEMLSRSIERAPSADAYNHRGIARYDLDQWDPAIADYSQALRIDADHGEALNNRAWTYFRTGRAKDGLRDADKAVQLLADKAFVWDTRGHINEALGRRDSALEDYRKALSIEPESRSSRDGLARLGAKP